MELIDEKWGDDDLRDYPSLNYGFEEFCDKDSDLQYLEKKRERIEKSSGKKDVRKRQQIAKIDVEYNNRKADLRQAFNNEYPGKEKKDREVNYRFYKKHESDIRQLYEDATKQFSEHSSELVAENTE